MKLLVLTHRLPFPPNRGDRVRAYHIIRMLAARADVRLVSLVHDATEAAHAGALRSLGVKVWTVPVPRRANLVRGAFSLLGTQPLTHALLSAPAMPEAIARATADGLPDVVFAYCSGVAPVALAPPLGDVPLVLDLVDVDSAKWAAYAERADAVRAWIYAREARQLARFEVQAVRAAQAATVVNERERQALLKICPDARVHVVGIGVDGAAWAPPGPAATDPRVIFTGVFNYFPNVEGAIWLAREVWPRVRETHPRARLTLAGAHPTSAITQLAQADASIEVTGAVEDMRPYLWQSAVSVAPLLLARGVQTKVLEAAAAGVPSVVTPQVWQGLPVHVHPACRHAQGAGEFASAINNLLALPATERRRIAARAQVASLAWGRQLAPLFALIEHAARARSRPRQSSSDLSSARSFA